MDFSIKSLGERTITTNSVLSAKIEDNYIISDNDRLLYNTIANKNDLIDFSSDITFELAGPRDHLYFNPADIKSAIVTCGGLCPGINNVIRSIVMQTWYRYGSRSILGIKYGYSGLNPVKGYYPIELTPELVRDIHLEGGTILGSSRGGTEDMNIQVSTLQHLGVSILYCIGGDGTLKGAHELHQIAEKRGYKLAIIGVPKTIDNDISYIQRSFGFETAFSTAVESIYSAHVEAEGAPNGIGLVKLMGRHSGFIAANAALAMNLVNFVLVPEISFDLYGPNGFLRHLEDRLLRRGHAVICVAEGAGQELIEKEKSGNEKTFDASGNTTLDDVGIFLKDKIKAHFKEKQIEINLKYIDPSYIIRSAPACSNDSIFCTMLGQYAVHAGMAGKTDCVIGQWNNVFTHIPIELAISKRKEIDSQSPFWRSVLEATGQPVSMLNEG